MALFCNKCGESLSEGVMFCPNCGNQVGTPKVEELKQETGVRKVDNTKKNIFNVIVVFLAVVALFLMVKQFNGVYSSPEASVKNFMKGLANGDSDKVLKSLPEEMLDDMSASDKRMFKAIVVEFEEYFKDLRFEVVDTEELEDDDLEDIQYEYENYFKVKKAYNVEVEITAEVYEEEYSSTLDFEVVKIGSKYYVVSSDFF